MGLTARCFALSLALALLPDWGVRHADAKLLESLNFAGPFLDVDRTGNRNLGSSFQVLGHADVNENFIRLTPDRQSKRGGVWSKDHTSGDFSAVLKFRIAGQGKTLFGDGLALWFTNEGVGQWHRGNEVHGAAASFTGFGVIIDTFKNPERPHRDVSIFVNNGTRGLDDLSADPAGCDATLRYYEGRDDFSARNASRVRVSYAHPEAAAAGGGIVSVDLDAGSSGAWQTCAVIDDVALPAGWADKVHVGLSASTGALADNHDVLSFAVYDSDDEKLAERAERSSGASHAPPLTDFKHHVEHQFAAVYDHVEATKLKLQEQEGAAERRIGELEAKLSAELLAHLETRVGLLERELHDRAAESLEGRIVEVERRVDGRSEQRVESRVASLEASVRKSSEGAQAELVRKLKDQNDESQRRIKALEDRLSKKIDSGLRDQAGAQGEALASLAQQAGGGWKGPFVALVAVLALAGAGLFVWFRELKKQHLL